MYQAIFLLSVVKVLCFSLITKIFTTFLMSTLIKLIIPEHSKLRVSEVRKEYLRSY